MQKIERSDVIVVGAGLLGCFAARSLRKYDISVKVLEAREDICTGISKANTAIVYTGCDTKPGSLKTELCVKANAGFQKLCSDLGVPFSRCGSLMVSFGPNGEKVLKKKFEQGTANGVPGLRLLNAAETRETEPNLSENVTASLYAPGTGTVNPWLLCAASYENAVSNGADFRFDCRVTDIERVDGGFRVIADGHEFFSKAVINCAGLNADEVREMTEKPLVRIFETGADYFVMGKNTDGGVSHIIFHEPEVGKKGLTLVPTTDGNILVGPSEREASHTPDAADTDGLRSLEKLCAVVVPDLDLDNKIRCFAGSRPNPGFVEPDGDGYRKSDRGIHDFSIFEESGLFSLIGIKTPGLTCAHELNELIASHVAEYIGCKDKNADYSPIRKPIPKVSELPFDERKRLADQDPAFGRILCRCGEITEGEIVEAIRRGAKTVCGVKRRVGTGMGKCQGSRCSEKIAEIIARELKIPFSSVKMDGPGSEMVKGGACDGV